MAVFRKVIGFFLVLGWLIFLAAPVQAKEEGVGLHFFWAKSCPHCAKEEVFLESLEKEYPQLEIKRYEVSENKENLELLEQFGRRLMTEIEGVPFTVVGREYFSGYLSDETTGVGIRKAVEREIEGAGEAARAGIDAEQKGMEKIKVPLLGEVRIKELSLPVLTVVVAGLDGFNPCAMWTLLFLIGLLLGMKNRMRMWILGGAFIVTSGLVYFLFLSAWLNLFLFLGFVFWVRVLIGAGALAAGGYYLRDALINKSGSCKVTEGKKRQRIFEKIKLVTHNEKFIFALIGIIVLAFAVNLVELICSAGLPAIYTQVLSLADLPLWQYYLYLVFYVLIFMLDDLIVFVVAMATLKAVGFNSRYARYSHLIGGVLMLIIGVLMLFKPEWLMLG